MTVLLKAPIRQATLTSLSYYFNAILNPRRAQKALISPGIKNQQLLTGFNSNSLTESSSIIINLNHNSYAINEAELFWTSHVNFDTY